MTGRPTQGAKLFYSDKLDLLSGKVGYYAEGFGSSTLLSQLYIILLWCFYHLSLLVNLLQK